MKHKKNVTSLPLGTLRSTRTAAAIGAAVTGMSVVYSIVFPSASEVLPYWAAVALSLLVVGIVSYVVDFGLFKESQYLAAFMLSGKAGMNWKTITAAAILGVFVLGQIATSVALSWHGREDIAAAIVEKPQEKDVGSIATTTSSTLSAIVAGFDKDIAEQKARIKPAEALAKKGVVKTESMDWAKWSRKVAAAQKKATAPIHKSIDKLQAAKAKAIADHQAAASATTTAVIASNAAAAEQYSSALEKRKGWSGYFGVGCVAVFLLITAFLALHDSGLETTEYKGDFDMTGEGKADPSPTPEPIAEQPPVTTPAPQRASGLFTLPPQQPPPPSQGAGFRFPETESTPSENARAGFQFSSTAAATLQEVKEIRAEVQELKGIMSDNSAAAIENESIEISEGEGVEDVLENSFEWELTPAESEIAPVPHENPVTLDDVRDVVKSAVKEGVCAAQGKQPVPEGVKILHELGFHYERHGNLLKVDGCTGFLSLAEVKRKVKEYQWKLENQAKTEKTRNKHRARIEIFSALVPISESIQERV